jgi:hypothetical protein
MSGELPVTTEELLAAFDRQTRGCEMLGSPWTAAVLRVLREDIETGGPARELFRDYRLPPHPSAAALRVAGGLNALATEEPPSRVPALGALHPSRRADGHRTPGFVDAVMEAVLAGSDVLADFLARPVQTNEVQRSGALVPGLLEIAGRSGLPLDLFEIGSSGGLNLLWDSFACRFGDRTIGPDPEVGETRVRIEPGWSGAACPDVGSARVRTRRGVDLTPLDLRDPAVRRRGRAYVWPDQQRRLANFDAAVDLLRESEVRVEAGNAAAWLPGALAERDAGACAVVMHSVMWQYMPPEDRQAVEATIRAEGARALPERPLAWLRFEPRRDAVGCELTLDLWPRPDEGTRERLAWTHPHGSRVRWLAADAKDRFADSGPFEEDRVLG